MTSIEGDRCPRCGGTDVVRGIELNQNAEVGRIGLEYKAAGIFRGTEQLLADLCRGCGTVVRLFVQTTDRRWITRP
jgi:hypothetical protein